MSADDTSEKLPSFMGWPFGLLGGLFVSVAVCSWAAGFLSGGIAYWIGGDSWASDCLTLRGRSCAVTSSLGGTLVGVVLLLLAAATPPLLLWRSGTLARVAGVAWSASSVALFAVLTAAAMNVIRLFGMDDPQESTSLVMFVGVAGSVAVAIIWTVLYHILKLFRVT